MIIAAPDCTIMDNRGLLVLALFDIVKKWKTSLRMANLIFRNLNDNIATLSQISRLI